MKKNDKDPTVDVFFDSLSDEYASAIERCFPRYREMLWALLQYIPNKERVESILEIGCGTGNLTLLVRDHFPSAKIRAVDVSSESLEVCKSRMKPDARVTLDQQDIRDFSCDRDSFDLVISSITIHHLASAEKRFLFKDVHHWLRPGGIFTFADQLAGAHTDVYQQHVALWKEAAIEAGSTNEEWQMWMQHQRQHDHHDPLFDQFTWLREAGYQDIDVTWRYLLWTVLQARPIKGVRPL